MLSTRMAVHGITAAGRGLLAGQWLDRAPFPLNYQVLFLQRTGSGDRQCLALGSHSRCQQSPASAARRPHPGGDRKMMALINTTPPSSAMSPPAFVLRMGLLLPMALFSIYRVRTLGSSDAWIGMLLTVERLVSVGGLCAAEPRAHQPARAQQTLDLVCWARRSFPFTMALARPPRCC